MVQKSCFFRTTRRALIVALSLCAMSDAGAAAPSSDESAFMAENDAAMSKMTKSMSVTPSGNVDEDFVALMQAHHQAAIEMAEAELRHGHNEQLRHIAQTMIVQQQQDIAAMRDAMNQAAAPPAPGPTMVPHKNPKMDGPPGS